jgi:predicted glycoside hydrolase/deacetylase ChbG (UPF0249 family)
MSGERYLIVIADDFGIGLDTSRAILELAAEGLVTGTVLLVNSPYADEAVRAWRRGGQALEVGWHPSLTLDCPVLPAGRVPSLVGPDGCFWPLGLFLTRVLLGRIRAEEVRAELRAQYRRFHDLVGHAPAIVNSHQHTALFEPVGRALLDLLGRRQRLPYLRRVREPWSMLAAVPGARLKRGLLSALGRRQARRQERLGFPGNDWLAGITDPPCVADGNFLARWLTRVPGRVVELACHPGYYDATLVGRDCTAHDGRLERRVRELELLRHATFTEACRRAGFRLVTPGGLVRRHAPRPRAA